MKKIIDQVSSHWESLQNLKQSYLEKQQTIKTAKAPKAKKSDVQLVQLEISSLTVFKIVLIIFGLLALKDTILQLQSLLVITSLCLFLTLGLSPILDQMERWLSRPLAILVLYALFFGVLGVLFVKLIPIIAIQLQAIASDIRMLLAEGKLEELPVLGRLMELVNFDTGELEMVFAEGLSAISQNLQNIAGSTFAILSGVFQGVFNFFFAAVLLFFMLIEREKIGYFSLLMFPEKNRGYVASKFLAVQDRMGSWFRGQFILMLSVGICMYVGMKILEIFFGMQYAATIGLVAGIMEIFPYIGIIITGILSVLVAMNISWFLVALVLIWIGIVQFLEGNVLVPLIMEKVTGLPTVVVMLAIAIGGILGSTLGGVTMVILGMIFAVPLAASIALFVEEYLHRDD